MSTGSSFRFRLERVRALRERREDLAREELAKAVSRLAGSRDRLQAVDAQLQRIHAEQRLAASTPQAVDVQELRTRQAIVEHVEAQRAGGARELAQREADVAERDDELGLAARDHRMLERLKERQHAEHDREARRQEGLVLDEIAIDRFRRSAA
ncbi:MAG TPA: flagellar export protein FliJ [Solirubrobacteraceae bacterium]